MSVVLWCDKGPQEHPIHRSAESIRHLTWIDRVGRQFRLLYEPCPALPSPSQPIALPSADSLYLQVCPPVLLITINNSTLHGIPEPINSFIYRASYQTYCCISVDQRLSFSCWYLCFMFVRYPVRYLSAAFGWGFFSVHSVVVKVYQNQAINP
jgi:hypothetical protein